MKKNLLLLLLFPFLVSTLSAQRFDIGFGFLLYHSKGTDVQTRTTLSSIDLINNSEDINDMGFIPAAHVNYSYPLFKINTDLSIQGYSGIQGAVYFNKQNDIKDLSGQTVAIGASDFKSAFQVPLYALLSFGSYRNNDSDKDFGGSIGGGISAFGFSIPYDKGFMMMPGAMIQVHSSSVALRYEVFFSSFKSYYKSNVGNIPRIENNFYQVVFSMAIRN